MQPNWATGNWSNCTAVSGAADGNSTADEPETEEGSGDDGGTCPGIKLRNVYCEQIASGGHATIVDENLCNEDERPIATKLCSDESDEAEEASKPEVRTVWLFKKLSRDHNLREINIEKLSLCGI